ncbi:uncharacterized protein EV420DRAFT_578132 [Desarmillaria tabescens]|uniref:DUF6534 domain-containing protein n=1 Tax=Armillaria tabescens TaxID=1929756 RepID=A0AA39N2I9_ARMTA|nr:uncharacterized protein EV420DRAFT_578132 [Desarmillaria tabescens]KAK0455582.1 hypothetical protein EV420DRAFT_578132 [Desarmillaria tabescens]
MSPATVHLSPTPDFLLFSGIEVLAILFTMALWGISCLQIFLYFFNTQEDSCYIKGLVIWLWSMDTVHQGLLISGVYKAIRDNATASTDHISWEYLIQILFTILVTTPAQGFFSYRIWMFSNKSKLIISFLAPAILFQLIDGIIFMAINLPATDKLQFTTSTSKGIAIAYFIDGAVVDLFIAVTMCLFLWRRYLRIGIATKGTRSMIHRLTLFSINTGSWPAIIAIITLVMLLAYPTYYLYAGLYFFLSPVYCNTVLASINARPYIQSVNNGRHIYIPKESGLQFASHDSQGVCSNLRGTPHGLELASYKVGPEESTEGNDCLNIV